MSPDIQGETVIGRLEIQDTGGPPVLLSWERRAPARLYGNSIQCANQEIGVPRREKKSSACAALEYFSRRKNLASPFTFHRQETKFSLVCHWRLATDDLPVTLHFPFPRIRKSYDQLNGYVTVLPNGFT